MKKITEIKTRTLTGTEVTIKVNRQYGIENIELYADGYKVPSKQMVDSYRIDFQTDRFSFTDCQLIEVNGILSILGTNNKGQRAALQIEKEDMKKVISLAKEILGEPIEYKTVNFESEEDKAVIYDKVNNEGGEGYNPYRNNIKK